MATLTADLAFDRYSAFYERDALVQSSWHSRDADGRELACGLGALDPEINSAADCPSSVMPRWLAQMVPWFFDNQPFDDAKGWGLAFYAELKRLKGAVPFSVVHDWQATIVGPMNVEICEAPGWDAALPLAVQRLHERALAGDLAPRDEWFAALKPSLQQAYRKRYADAYAYANAYADAHANANAYAYADAHANANAYADAHANAYAYANANANTYTNPDTYKQHVKRLASGMVECLKRVPTPEA
jgi:hypothetical protein